MLTLRYVLLYVDSPEKSAALYRDLLGTEPVEQSPTFAMFATGGIMLGLWSRHTVEPGPAAAAGAAEIAFDVPDVDAATEALRARGLRILQEPTNLDFGRTAVALDLDGHRLRVLTPG